MPAPRPFRFGIQASARRQPRRVGRDRPQGRGPRLRGADRRRSPRRPVRHHPGADGRGRRHDHPAHRLARLRQRLPPPRRAGQGGGHPRRALRRAPRARASGPGWMPEDYDGAGIAVRSAEHAHRPPRRGGHGHQGPVRRRALRPRRRRTTRSAMERHAQAGPATAPADPHRRRRPLDPDPRRPGGRHHRPQHRPADRAHRRRRPGPPRPPRPPTRRSGGSATRPATASTTSSSRCGSTWPWSPTTSTASPTRCRRRSGSRPSRGSTRPTRWPAASIRSSRRASPGASASASPPSASASTPWTTMAPVVARLAGV